MTGQHSIEKTGKTAGTGIDRRTFLKAAGVVGLFATVPWNVERVQAVGPGALLGVSALSIPESDKWSDPLPRPGVMTPVSRTGGVDYYEIAETQFTQTVLPSAMGKTTTLWGYEGTYPAATIEARPGREVRVKWINDLPSSHVLTDSVDTLVHGADHDAPEVRTVVHVHGAVTRPRDDGYPEAWVAPDGTTDSYSPVAYKETKVYPNEQEPATLWYHDHAIGITRLNVYAGLAGFYMLRDPAENSLPSGEFEVPILLQDRSFNEDGSLFYPSGIDDEFEAEFFGDVPVVNGKAYPHLEVEPRKYRFRLLNGSNGRTFNVKLYNETTDSATDVPLFQQIGVDLGFLDEVVTVGPGGVVPTMLLSGAERADVIVDFSGFDGKTFTLRNGAPTPYAGEAFVSADDPAIDMPELLQIRVTKPLSGPDDSVPPAQFLKLIGRRIDRYGFEPAVTDSGITRTFTLDSTTLLVDEQNDLEYDSHFLDLALWTDEDAVVRPTLNTSETWEFVNTTGDSHPIHMHLVDFEVLNRESFTWNDGTGDDYAEAAQDYMDGEGPRPAFTDYATFSGTPTLSTPNNRYNKDTVLVNPNEVVRIEPAFTGFTGYYVWHCHILEHEDQEMMLPYEIVAP